MSKRITISKGECFIKNSPNCFSIGETTNGYTLCKSVICSDKLDGEKQWAAAGEGEIPDGWKACSDEIPADTQHDVYDVVPGTCFYLMGLTDNEKVVITY